MNTLLIMKFILVENMIISDRVESLICRRALASITKMISTIPENIFLLRQGTGGHGNYIQAILSKLEYPNSDIILHLDFRRGISFLSMEYLNVISTKDFSIKRIILLFTMQQNFIL